MSCNWPLADEMCRRVRAAMDAEAAGRRAPRNRAVEFVK